MQLIRPTGDNISLRFSFRDTPILTLLISQVHTPAINEGGKGLEGVLYGLQLLKENKVSGKKLVYTAN